MTIIQLKSRLLDLFPDDMHRSTSLNGNEFYLQVDARSIIKICIFLNEEMGYSLVTLFACDERTLSGKYAIYYGFSDRQNAKIIILKTEIDPSSMSFLSISAKVHAATAYEREIKDLFGLVPIGHPDAKRMVFHGNWPNGVFPLRKDYDLHHKPHFSKKETKFKKITGDGVFEIPVGPVHAGIIEPGHFRFNLAGEPILNLEAQLYYVHKGIEKIAETMSIERCFYLSERISGDETFANSFAYCQAIEKIAEVSIPERADYSRVLFAELERLTSHLGDLAGICLDVAYGFAAFQFRMLRGWSYLVADELCGMRFLRSVNKPGGIRKDFVAGKEKSLIEQLLKIERELKDTVAIINANTMFIDRIENTGILKNTIARDLNAVGPGGRASGINHDVRKDFPYAAYPKLTFEIPIALDGDVNSRMRVKLEECFTSISLMLQAIETMPQGPVNLILPPLASHHVAFGLTEAPRGENIHWVMTGKNDTIFRYKIRTPSFCNWPVLCHAVSGNIVPDFPLINKSFNLSYAGNDL